MAKWLVALVAAASLAPLGAFAAGEARTIEIAVTKNGFEPARVKVNKGEPLKLVLTRKTDETCAKQIVIPDENIRADLPLGKPVTLSFTPKRAGEIRYSCGLNMMTGVLEVASSDAVAPGEMRGMRGEGAGSEGASAMGGHGSRGDSAMHGMGCWCTQMHGGQDGENGS